jgi:hypothetical protein
LLKDIAALLQENGRTLEDFGFPIPLDISTEIQRHMIKYGDVEEQQRILQELNNTSPNTVDQYGNVLPTPYQIINLESI